MTRFYAPLPCFAVLLFSCLSATSHASDHQVTYSDQNFFTEDWTPIVHVTDDTNVAGSPPLTSLGSITRQTTGGNPGAYLRSIHHNNLGDIITTTGIYVDGSYDPRQRAISTFDFSISVNHFNNTPLTGTDVALALLQNGRMFVSSPTQIFSGNQWVQRSDSALNSDDFLAIDFFITGAVIRPDFSAFGDPIQFGYALSNRVLFGTTTTQARGIDNWSVTLNLAEMSDIHGDGVDGVDLGFWEAGYAAVSAGEALLVDGDFDADADTDGADFLKWQRQFGSGVPVLSATTIVPEPSSLSLLAMNLFALLAAKGRRCRKGLR